MDLDDSEGVITIGGKLVEGCLKNELNFRIFQNRNEGEDPKDAVTTYLQTKKPFWLYLTDLNSAKKINSIND